MNTTGQPWFTGSHARYIAALAIAGVLAGCAGNPIHNQPLTAAAAPAYDFRAWIDAHDHLGPNLVALSFSGGGVRATALAASVGQQLHALGLDEQIAIVSSTSGGSVAAGFLAAKGAGRLNELQSQFLLHDNEGDLTPTLIGDLLSGANRSQHFASYLDERVFDGGSRTYGELIRRWDQAPFVILNATDMSSGQTFEFTQASFDSLCSDIGSFSVAEAVAASAAFPFLMSPITLGNHWNVAACRDGPAPFSNRAFDAALERRYVDLERFVLWRHRYALRHTYDPDAKPPPYRRIEYVHLLDGGLSDNLAARALLRAFADNVDQLMAKGVRRLLLVQVNAKSDPPQAIDHSPESPSLISVFRSVALNPIDVTTALSAYVSREYMVALVHSVNSRVTTGSETQLHFYPVQVDFDQLETASAEQMRAKALNTSWSLPAADIKFLDDVGRSLLERHPCFQAFARDAGDARLVGVPTGQAAGCDQFISVQIAQSPPPAPAPAAARPTPPPPPAPAAKPPPPAMKVTFAADAFFDFDKATLKPEGRAKLDDLFRKISTMNLEVVIAVGYTDSVGMEAYNQSLSMRRAGEVKAYLVGKGVDKDRIYIGGKGEQDPIASNQTSEGRAKNRRVEIEVIGTRPSR